MIFSLSCFAKSSFALFVFDSILYLYNLLPNSDAMGDQTETAGSPATVAALGNQSRWSRDHPIWRRPCITYAPQLECQSQLPRSSRLEWHLQMTVTKEDTASPLSEHSFGSMIRYDSIRGRPGSSLAFQVCIQLSRDQPIYHDANLRYQEALDCPARRPGANGPDKMRITSPFTAQL